MLVKKPVSTLIIMTKCHDNWIKIVDFQLKAYLSLDWMTTLFDAPCM